jgi:hypothetical protein
MRHTLQAALLLITGLTVAGCAVAGTTAIRNGRAAYNEAMVATNNEQLLAMIEKRNVPAMMVYSEHVKTGSVLVSRK